tara:strand:- start:121 stop:705 length:585 start_codon:yes stop_codon:yes gene_type:complete
MKKYNIPVNWIQKGVVAINAETLTDAVSIASAIDLSTANIVGQTAPDTTRVAYNGISTYVQGERLYDEIVMYTSSKVPSCPFCEKAKQWFKKHNIEYKTVDIMLDRDKGEEMLAITGSMAMPQIQVGNEILVGFIEEQAEQAFRHYGYITDDADAKSPKVVKMHTEAPPASEAASNPDGLTDNSPAEKPEPTDV